MFIRTTITARVPIKFSLKQSNGCFVCKCIYFRFVFYCGLVKYIARINKDFSFIEVNFCEMLSVKVLHTLFIILI